MQWKHLSLFERRNDVFFGQHICWYLDVKLDDAMDYRQNGDGRGVCALCSKLADIWHTWVYDISLWIPRAHPVWQFFYPWNIYVKLGPGQHRLACKLCIWNVRDFMYDTLLACMELAIYGTHILATDDKSLWIGSLVSGNFATQALFMSDRRCYKYRNY